MNNIAMGAIKNILLPENFVPGKETIGGNAYNWSRKFFAKENPEVELSFHYRGMKISGNDAKAFFDTVRRPPQLVFAHSDFIPPTVLEKNLVKPLGRALGNAGNNQLTNEASGIRGPRFFIEQLQVKEIKQKHVLLVAGYFHNPEGEFSQAFRGIFFQAGLPEDGLAVEEIFIQTPSKELAEKYQATFDTMLETIEWA
ncbi:MAG: hypothetical protein K2W82_14910 [Candidatus Obscuribacterales bacterium]|nr:hypothetical protein [Candidatus Obscuribacterales bacterium]